MDMICSTCAWANEHDECECVYVKDKDVLSPGQCCYWMHISKTFDSDDMIAI